MTLASFTSARFGAGAVDLLVKRTIFEFVGGCLGFKEKVRGVRSRDYLYYFTASALFDSQSSGAIRP